MAQEHRPGEIVPQSGIYTITHDPAHADMPHEVTPCNKVDSPGRHAGYAVSTGFSLDRA